MAPGAIYSHFSVDNDEIELNDAGIEQRHETEQTSLDLFNKQLCEESLIQTRWTKKNTRDCNYEDIETTQCNKKSKTGDEMVDEEEDASATFNTTSCSLGLIKTAGDNKGICIINLNQVFLSSSLVFKEEFDQKVTITRVPGNDKVTSVEVRRPGSYNDVGVRSPGSYIHVGVGNTCCLNEGDLLIIGSIQNPYEYKVVRVDNYRERYPTTTNDDFEDFESVSAILGEINSTDWTTETMLEGEQLETNSGQPYTPIDLDTHTRPQSATNENQSSEESRKDKENDLAQVELPVLKKDSQEAVITSNSHNKKTIAPLAQNLVTPEKDRKKKGITNAMLDPPIETMIEESESQSVTESTGLCGGRRYLSDLNSLDPTTKFPTNWMSDRSDYDSEATVDDNERYCLDKSESGDVRAINVKDDVDFLRQRLLAEEKEKEILDASMEKKK